jgi:hypothetical protein
MAKRYPVVVARPIKFRGGKRYPGHMVEVHRQARDAMLSSGDGVKPEDAHLVTRLNEEAMRRFESSGFTLDTPPENLPGRLGTNPDAEARETKPESPSEYREDEGEDEPEGGVELAKAALGAGYPQRKSACAKLGLSGSGTDDLLVERLETYIDEHGG